MLLPILALLLAQPTSSSPLAPSPNGMHRADPSFIALANCTAHPRPGDSIPHATILLRDGIILDLLPASPGPDGQLGTDDDLPATPPPDARLVDCTGLHAYPAFIEPYLELDTPKPPADTPGLHWNSAVTPQRSALDGAPNLRRADASLRKLGFAAACITPRGGIFRGSSALVSLASPPDEPSAARPPVYRAPVYQSLGLSTAGDDNPPQYPSSLMGAIALIRQTLSDADWQSAARAAHALSDPTNCLDALTPSTTLLFDTSDELDALRALKIAREFNRAPLLLGSGSEFKRLPALLPNLPANPSLLLPLNFPKEPDVASVSKAAAVELEDLMAWEQAPTNPRRLANAHVPFALTTHRLKNRDDFLSNLRTAIKHGLSEDDALAALTTIPASILHADDSLGSIDKGKRANILLADSPLFAPKNPDTNKPPQIRDLYIDGLRHEINPPPSPKLDGEWTLDLSPAPGATPFPNADRALLFDKDNALSIKRNAKSVKGEKLQLSQSSISFVFDHAPLNESPDGPTGVYTLSGILHRDAAGRVVRLSGAGTRPDGSAFHWAASRLPPHPFLGAWRVFETDGAPRDPNAKEGLTIDIAPDSITLTFSKDSGEPIVIKADDFSLSRDAASFSHPLDKLGGSGKSADALRVDRDTLLGESTLPDGSKHSYKASRLDPRKKQDDDDKAERDRIAAIPEKLPTPFGPFGLFELPPQSSVLFTNATLWTNSDRGVLEHAWILIDHGVIAALGSASDSPPAASTTIDCAGKHIAPGIIDCHSHTGISRGVNEGGRAVSAECRIADVTDPDAISWYRQLAGGVTAVNSLHGSANAIGGQSQTNKIRWGCAHPDDMHFESAIPGIKFALGENPRGANWGGDPASRSRYPQSRMGVETLIRDRFTQAKEYAARRTSSSARRDLQLDALAEVLAGSRLVHCHSYRQDEIVMLTQVARDFHFKIGTFQHILEGYKVADFVRDFSGGASGFTDWWAYKIEVQDAIPYAFPIMHEVGVTCSFNSDSDELARRLNVEAGKAVKYSAGRISPPEALKFVTLNPAKQLHVDSRVGSLEVGKDADLALWSAPPWSAFARCEATYVDGRRLFSLDDDANHRRWIATERQRLIQKLLAKPKVDKSPDKPGDSPADSTDQPRRRRRPTDDALRDRLLQLFLEGKSLDTHRCGDCGCDD